MTPDQEQPRVSRNRRRGGNFNFMPRLLGAIVVVVAIAVALNLGIHKLERSPPLQPEYAEKKPVKVEDAAPSEEDVLPAPLGIPADSGPVQGIAELDAKRPQIEIVLRSFFQARAIEDKLIVARDPERVRALMRQYYLERPILARAVKGVGSCQSVAEKGFRLGYVQVQFTQGASLSVIVEEMEDGQFRVDWESLVRYGEMEWSDFLDQKPTSPTLLRVIATRLQPVAGDPREWLQIMSPGEERSLKVVFDRTDPKMTHLVDQLTQGSWKNVPLTVRLCYFEPKSNPDSLRIVSSEGKGWLILTDRRS